MVFVYFMVGKPYANSKPGDQGFPALEANAIPHTQSGAAVYQFSWICLDPGVAVAVGSAPQRDVKAL